MRALILIAGAALAVAACSNSDDTANNSTNTTVTLPPAETSPDVSTNVSDVNATGTDSNVGQTANDLGTNSAE
jgi:hypothetical protein